MKYPNEVRQLPRGKPGSPVGRKGLYVANPVYIELSQGGASPMRGMFAVGGLLAAAGDFFFSIASLYSLTWEELLDGFPISLFFPFLFLLDDLSLCLGLLFLIGPTDLKESHVL